MDRAAGATGLPVGIKSAVGHLGFWRELYGYTPAREWRGIPGWPAQGFLARAIRA